MLLQEGDASGKIAAAEKDVVEHGWKPNGFRENAWSGEGAACDGQECSTRKHKKFAPADRRCPRAYAAQLSFSGGRVNHTANRGNAIGREAALRGMVAYGLFVGGDVDAIDFVVGDVALDPLHAGKSANHPAGFLRDGVQVGSREFAGARNFAFD